MGAHAYEMVADPVDFEYAALLTKQTARVHGAIAFWCRGHWIIVVSTPLEVVYQCL